MWFGVLACGMFMATGCAILIGKLRKHWKEARWTVVGSSDVYGGSLQLSFLWHWHWHGWIISFASWI